MSLLTQSVAPASASGITLDTLTAFIQVSETLNVSEAAAGLSLSKSVISKRIAQLEGRLSATLFSRSTRRVSLTPAGEAFLEHARRALSEVSTGQERLHAMRSELTGLIRMTAPVSWGQQVLSRMLPEFLRLHPSIEVELHLDDQIIDLAEKRFDLALRWSGKSRTGLRPIPIMKVGWLLAATPQYLNTYGRPKTPADLTAHSCMAYWKQRSDEVWTLENTLLQKSHVRVKSRYHVDNADSVAYAALAGLGIALLPDYLCAQPLQNGQLEAVLVDWLPKTKYGPYITVLGTPERMALARNQTMVQFLRSQFQV